MKTERERILTIFYYNSANVARPHKNSQRKTKNRISEFSNRRFPLKFTFTHYSTFHCKNCEICMCLSPGVLRFFLPNYIILKIKCHYDLRSFLGFSLLFSLIINNNKIKSTCVSIWSIMLYKMFTVVTKKCSENL